MPHQISQELSLHPHHQVLLPHKHRHRALPPRQAPTPLQKMLRLFRSSRHEPTQFKDGDASVFY